MSVWDRNLSEESIAATGAGPGGHHRVASRDATVRDAPPQCIPGTKWVCRPIGG